MPIDSVFQKRLLHLIEETDLNRVDFAKASNTDYGSLSNALAYGIVPSTKTLIKLADYLGVSFSFLLGKVNTNDFIKSEKPTTFQVRFELLCKGKGVTHYRVSQDCFFDTSIVTRWLKNGYIPAIEILDSLSKYFNVSIDYLLGRTDFKI